MMLISIAVIVIVTALCMAAMFRRRRLSRRFRVEPRLSGRRNGRSWIVARHGASRPLFCFAVTIWTVFVLAAIARVPTDQAASFRLQVIGHQWWWEVRYLGDDPSQTFTTANEIHIPVGQAVQVTLRTRRHPFVLGAGAGGKDRCHPRADQ